jgi:4-hydroxy-tetrahydrodipicolinate synthase
MKMSLTRRDFLLYGAATANVFSALLARAQTEARRATHGENFSGIFAILSTPFDPKDQVDVEDLAREVNFCIQAEAHGLVWPQLFGEFSQLSEDERLRGAEVILSAATGRIPVVIGVQASDSRLSVKFAQHAQDHGASAVISLPPYSGSVSLEAAAPYYHLLAQETTLPIFVQNSGPPWGQALPTEFVIQLAKQSPQFGYIKEEVAPVAHRIYEYAQSGVMKGIFSGNAGRNVLDEISHGANGTMPACEFIDVDVQVCTLALQGRLHDARAIFEKLLPMINLEGIYGLQFAKEVLVRRGVFKTAKLRGVSGGALDEKDRKEVEAWWEELAPYLRIQELAVIPKS